MPTGTACLVVVMAAASFLMTSEAKGRNKSPGDFFTLCHRSDPNINECVKNSVNEGRSKIVEGIPEMMLPPMDPMHIPVLDFKDVMGNLGFSMVMRNITMHGLSKFEIASLKIDLAKPYVEVDLIIPALQFESDYEIDGKVLVLPIKGNGDMSFSFEGVRALAKVLGKFVSRGGQQYLEIQDFKWLFDVQHAQSHFNNLFNGDKRMGDSANKFLNENWKEIFQSMKFLPERAFGGFFKKLGNKVLSKFTYDQFLPK